MGEDNGVEQKGCVKGVDKKNFYNCAPTIKITILFIFFFVSGWPKHEWKNYHFIANFKTPQTTIYH
jgi:hypothetical protein